MEFGERKHVSVYLKAGKRAATSYYRFYQLFDHIDADFKYNLMIPDSKCDVFFPIANQPRWKQVYIFFYIYLRVLRNLIVDAIRKPEFIVFSRCIINKVLPYSYRLILKYLRREGCVIVWDFDDNIIGPEIARKNFDRLSLYANLIIVGSPILKELINISYQEKVIILPTTDGDMHDRHTDKTQERRIKDFDKIIRIVWVGTFSTLHYVKKIASAFEEAGQKLRLYKKDLHLIVVSDKELDYEANHFVLNNIKWDKDVAISQMLQSHIGIMPLEDNEITRGKCGFKLIQYLSVGLPIIGSSVGMNKIIINDRVGLSVQGLDCESWTNAILDIVSGLSNWEYYSYNAYKEWEMKYNISYNLNEWNRIFNQKIYVRN